ncbi:hypothetical protein EMCRGX_G025092 [Ephydatia muelleri]
MSQAATRTCGEHKADSLVIRLGLDEQSLIPTDLLFNSEDKQEDRGVQVPDHLGKRLPHDITIEQYGPSQWEGFEGSEEQDERGAQEPATKYCYRSPELTLSEMVCVLCIPAQMRLLDMLEFLSPVLKTITNIRIVRDATPNQYMMLLKFKIKDAAHSFFVAYNGKRYNSLEKGICQLAYISRVEIVKPPLRGMRKGLVELPSCPVCLERLDDSVLTILCNHSFHTNCLTQWQESTTCPVCRYMYTPDPVGGDNTCSSCDSKEDLWICLICGVVGCGRYVGGHANNHFVETQHTFAMHLDTGRVWDYAGDNYVHRLVQNKSDGKLVEVSGMTGAVAGEEKIDSIQLEYTYLLTTQLESQRLFFEEKIARFEKEANEQLQEKLTKLSLELNEEKELNRCLLDNQKSWKDRVTGLESRLEDVVKQKDTEIQDLKDQVRDLMFYLETQKKIEDSPDGARQEGQLIVTQSPQQKATPSRRKKKNTGELVGRPSYPPAILRISRPILSWIPPTRNSSDSSRNVIPILRPMMCSRLIECIHLYRAGPCTTSTDLLGRGTSTSIDVDWLMKASSM